MSAITAKASRKMKKYAVLTREPRCFLGSFDFSWEQRKLGDIASDMVAGGDIDKDLILAEGQYPVIANALTGDGIVGYYDKEYRVNAPAVTVTGRGDVGHAKARLVNFTPVVRLLSVKSEHDVFFLENAINTLKIVIESTGVPQLTVPQLAKYEVAFPRQLDEEEHIGAFFKQLDHLITLHQRKFEKLTNVKKSMLEKMFPQNGSSYPEIRFKGFTDPWEQRKFDEVFDCTVPNNTLSRAELSYDEGTVLNVHYGDVLIKYGSVLDVQKDDIPRIPHRCREDFNGALLQDGDVIIADTAEDETTGKACEIGNLQGSAIVSGLHTMVCRPRNRMALGYLGYYLNSNAYHHQLLPLMQGIKVLSLSRSNIQKTSVSYPIAVKEQQLIAYYFSQLDNLITLHQRQHFLHSTPDISLSVRLIHPFYTSSWEQRKAKEICSIGTGKSNTQDQVDDGKYPFYIRSDVPVRSNKYLYDCEAVITIGDGNIGKVFHYVNGKFDLHQRCYKMTDFKDIWGKYFFYYFSTKFYDRAMKMTAKATVDSVRLEMISEMDIKKPPQISEQKQIAEFFANLDNLITLHQRKGKAAVSGCSNDANNSKGVCCKARDFGYKCHKKDEPNRFDA